jgi:hypothetical protein
MLFGMDFTRIKLEETWFFTPKPNGGREFRVEIFRYEEQGTYGNRIYEMQPNGIFGPAQIGGSSPQKTVEESRTRAQQDIEQMLLSPFRPTL